MPRVARTTTCRCWTDLNYPLQRIWHAIRQVSNGNAFGLEWPFPRHVVLTAPTREPIVMQAARNCSRRLYCAEF